MRICVARTNGKAVAQVDPNTLEAHISPQADPSDYAYFLAEWQRLQKDGVTRHGAGNGDDTVHADIAYTERLEPGTVRCFAGELLMAGYLLKFPG